MDLGCHLVDSDGMLHAVSQPLHSLNTCMPCNTTEKSSTHMTIYVPWCTAQYWSRSILAVVAAALQVSQVAGLILFFA